MTNEIILLVAVAILVAILVITVLIYRKTKRTHDTVCGSDDEIDNIIHLKNNDFTE